HVRAAYNADDSRLDAEVAEGLEQGPSRRLAIAGIGALVGLALGQQLLRRRLVVDLIGLGDAALVAHRRALDFDVGAGRLGRLGGGSGGGGVLVGPHFSGRAAR